MSDVMQDSGSDDGIAPGKINEWRAMLLRHTKRATLGTVAVPDPEAPNGWLELPMLNVVMGADWVQLAEARDLLEEALPLARGFLERTGQCRSDQPAVVTVRKMVDFLKSNQ